MATHRTPSEPREGPGSAKPAQARRPLRSVLKSTAVLCMSVAALAIALLWSGLLGQALADALPKVAVVLCLWSTVLSLGLWLIPPTS